LGDILSLLEQRGRLSRTLIVVTGDHGVRSWVEDPAFSMGVTDNYSFQVPFLLYAPGVLHSSNILHWITSHIDVAPSILDMLGVSRNTDYEQGGALWDERIAQRATYFLANVFLGVDGYHSQGKFYSWNRTLDTAYENDQLQFGLKDIVPNRSAIHDKIRENLRELDELRSAWLRASEKPFQDDVPKRVEATIQRVVKSH
jgi:membrane-anchored protein YejM (alkaline phosphatase superfamily)